MREPAIAAELSSTQRERPQLHFTPRAGWINDPHGIVFVDGRYHLFFQYNPAGSVWSEACSWGHATSEDLLVWTEEDVALSPSQSEVGCWSGCLVFDGDVPTILYTRITGAVWAHGQVALARGSVGLEAWRRDPPEPVIAGPPHQFDVVAFRDPFVWRDRDQWRMVVGAGTTDGMAALLQYTSADLLDWRYDGVLAQRHTSEREGVWTGKLWECPQLFELDGSWVLLASVWSDDVLHYVVYALGDYNGESFVPRKWGRFSHGDELYATTAFVDAKGRRCVMSWLRERDNTAPAGSPFAGALSMPHVLAIERDRLVVRHHPNLDDHLVDAVVITDAFDGRSGAPFDAVVRTPMAITIDYGPSPEAALRLEVEGEPDQLTIMLDHRENRLVVRSLGDDVMEIPLEDAGSAGTLSVVFDSDILEVVVSSASGVGATRVPDVDGRRLIVQPESSFEVSRVTNSQVHPTRTPVSRSRRSFSFVGLRRPHRRRNEGL